MPTIKKIAPCLWFDDQAEKAAKFYVGIFKRGSKITSVTRYSEAGREVHRRPPGSVMTVDFTLAGQPFTALNGGPVFKFNESISFQVNCKTQKELDYYWDRLSQGGEKVQCGWLKDKFGVSWQVVPTMLAGLMKASNSAGSKRAMMAMLKMKKLDIAALKRAYKG